MAPTGIRHSVKPAPTPGAKSSRITDSRSAAVSACSDVQPSSLKQAPKPAIGCSGASVWTMTSASPPVVVSRACFCHGDDFVVTYHSAVAASVCARRTLGAAEAATSAAAPFTSARRLTGRRAGEAMCRSLMAGIIVPAAPLGRASPRPASSVRRTDTEASAGAA